MMQEAIRRSMEDEAPEARPAVQPAGKVVIDGLPIHVVTGKTFRPPERKACIICMEDFCKGCELKTLPCFHHFHRGCLDKWLHQSGTCPICKTAVDTK